MNDDRFVLGQAYGGSLAVLDTRRGRRLVCLVFRDPLLPKGAALVAQLICRALNDEAARRAAEGRPTGADQPVPRPPAPPATKTYKPVVGWVGAGASGADQAARQRAEHGMQRIADDMGRAHDAKNRE